MRPKRKGLSKSVRFAVFARDGFTCRYCGRGPEDVQLVVDHITPVCQDGSNNPENLITSCHDCNAGKGGKTIAQAAPTESDRLRILQEYQEQNALHKAALESLRKRKEIKQHICNYFCEWIGATEMKKATLTTLESMVEQFGPDLVFEWIQIAIDRVGRRNEISVIKYICGIRRNYLKELEENAH